AADGRSAKALFVVRSATLGKTARILYKVPLFTYQAYNETGANGSLYSGAPKVTLRRTGGGHRRDAVGPFGRRLRYLLAATNLRALGRPFHSLAREEWLLHGLLHRSRYPRK